MQRLSLFLVVLLGLATVGCDQGTKHFAMTQLAHEPISLFPGVALTYTENRDMAFGLLARLVSDEGRLILLSFAKLLAILAGLWVFYVRRKVSTSTERVGLTLVLAGALGNLVDRLVHGFVVDMVQVPYWPVFNVADVAIVSGVILLGISILSQSDEDASGGGPPGPGGGFFDRRMERVPVRVRANNRR